MLLDTNVGVITIPPYCGWNVRARHMRSPAGIYNGNKLFISYSHFSDDKRAAIGRFVATALNRQDATTENIKEITSCIDEAFKQLGVE